MRCLLDEIGGGSNGVSRAVRVTTAGCSVHRRLKPIGKEQVCAFSVVGTLLEQDTKLTAVLHF